MDAQPPPSGARPGRNLKIAGGSLLLLAGVVVVLGVVVGIRAISGAGPVTVNGSATVEADEGGEYSIYRFVGGAVGAEDCRVQAPDGSAVPTRTVLGTETLSLNGTQYVVTRIFTAAASGAHTVTCGPSGYAVGPRVPVFRLVGSILATVFGALILGGAGVVVLVVGFGRDRRAAQPPHQQPPPQQAWPPQQPGPPPTA